MSLMEVDQENSDRIRSTAERKECYRVLLDKIEEIQDNEEVNLQTVKDLKYVLKEANNLDKECSFDKRVQHADETLMDSLVLSSASKLLLKCSQVINVTQTKYDANTFVEKLAEAYPSNSDVMNFDALLDISRSFIKELPNFKSIYGTFDPTALPSPKPVKERTRKEAQERAEKKFTQKITNAEKEEENIDEIVNFLLKVLQDEYEKNNSKPIPYYHYVIDKSCFVSTVENFFYTSFLIRDGIAEISKDEHGELMIKPKHKKAAKECRKQQKANTQKIITITMDKWKEINIPEGFLERHKKMRRENR